MIDVKRMTISLERFSIFFNYNLKRKMQERQDYKSFQ